MAGLRLFRGTGPLGLGSPVVAGDLHTQIWSVIRPLLRKLCFIFAILFVCLPNAYADDLSSLAASNSWKKLLHYEIDRSSPSGLRSAIHSPDFFLAESGAIQPEAELEASLSAMLLPLSENANEHAKCRFPARLIWLRQQFPHKHEQLADIECPEFAEWADPGGIESISLVFANGYLGNPASYYGHTFLKFNHRKSAGKSRLLDLTVNYGAILDGHDDPLSYIVKGVTGGYEGGFSPIEFYFHDANYGENELRDLWEFRLHLPAAATRLVVAHAWEVMKKRYVYYFFRHNCSYRVAELLEIVDGLEVIPRNRPWLIPQALVQEVSTSRFHGHPLIAETIFHPSRQSRLYAKYGALDAEAKHLVAQIVSKALAPDDLVVRELSLGQQQAVLDTLLDYYQFSLDRGKKESSYKSAPEYAAALAVRLQLPPGGREVVSFQPDSPDQGRAPSWMQLGISHSRQAGIAALLRLRPAYYDILDAGSAQVKNGALSMGDLQLQLNGEQLEIRQFDLLAINSMNPAVTGLRGDRGFGWKLKVGAEQERIACRACLVARAQGDVGMGRQLTTNLFAAIHVGGALQQNTGFSGAGFVRASGTMVFRPSAQLGFQFVHEERSPFRPDLNAYRMNSFEGRLAIGHDADLRLLWESDGHSRLTLGWGLYW